MPSFFRCQSTTITPRVQRRTRPLFSESRGPPSSSEKMMLVKQAQVPPPGGSGSFCCLRSARSPARRWGRAGAQSLLRGNPSMAVSPLIPRATKSSGCRWTTRWAAGCRPTSGSRSRRMPSAPSTAKRCRPCRSFFPPSRSPVIRAFISTPGRAGVHARFPCPLRAVPCGPPAGFSFITRDTLTQGQVHLNQTLFSGPVIAGWKAAGAATRAAHFAKMSARGEVVQQVASAYLHVIAAASEVDNAKALEQQDRVLFEQARAQHEAGTASNLDDTRARSSFNRSSRFSSRPRPSSIRTSSSSNGKSVSIPARRSRYPILLPTATSPSRPQKRSAPSPTRTARTTKTCKTGGGVQVVIRNAYRSQRFPTLSFYGFYGVTEVGTTRALTSFGAGYPEGPIFREPQLRGNIEAAQAQLDSATPSLTICADTSIRGPLRAPRRGRHRKAR